MKRRLLIIAGTVSVALGVIGIIVPVLPTTPFLLLAAACYIRSSETFYNRLLNNRILGPYINNYIQGRGMTVKAKLLTLSLLWITIGISLAFVIQNLVVRVVIILIAFGVTIYITRIKTYDGDEK